MSVQHETECTIVSAQAFPVGKNIQHLQPTVWLWMDYKPGFFFPSHRYKMWELYFDNCAAAVTIFWWVLKRKCWTCQRSRLFLSHTSTGFWRVVCTCESHVGVSTVSAWENRAAQTGGPDATVRCRGGSKCSSWVLCRCPAGKLSASPDGGTGRDEDDKVHRLKWFSSEAQLGDTKAHTVSPLLSVPHAHHLGSQHSVWTEWRRQKKTFVCFQFGFCFCFL